jgi:hypothetical protein
LLVRIIGIAILLVIVYTITGVRENIGDETREEASQSTGERRWLTFKDNEYGAKPLGSRCGSLKEGVTKIHEVSSFQEFDNAYRHILPGEAIVVQSGTYSWPENRGPINSLKLRNQTYRLHRNGTEDRPILIISESFPSVIFKKNQLKFETIGQYNIFAGFVFNEPEYAQFRLSAPNSSIVCNHFVNLNGLAVITDSQLSDHSNIGDNIFENSSRQAILINRCNPLHADCIRNAKGIHVYHNTFKDKTPGNGNGHEAIILGRAFIPIDSELSNNPDGDIIGAIVENNLFDRWNGENELISIKSSKNIVRNNCVIDSPLAGIKLRAGDSNLITGNWIENSGTFGMEIAGRDNLIAYNYFSKSLTAFRLHTGARERNGYPDPTYELLYAYVTPVRNSLIGNVIGQSEQLVEVYPRLDESKYKFMGDPTDNILHSNQLYSTRYPGGGERSEYVNLDSKLSEATFRANNTVERNYVKPRTLIRSSCGYSGLFDGPRLNIAAKLGLGEEKQFVLPPSWW